MSEKPAWMQSMITSGYRAVQIEMAGLDSLVAGVSCEAAMISLAEPANALAQAALRIYFPTAALEIEEVVESYTNKGWPRGLTLERRILVVGEELGGLRPYANVRLHHGMLNPREGEGYGMYVTLWSIAKPFHQRATYRLANRCGETSALHVIGDNITREEMDALIAAAGEAFQCEPIEKKRVE